MESSPHVMQCMVKPQVYIVPRTTIRTNRTISILCMWCYALFAHSIVWLYYHTRWSYYAWWCMYCQQTKGYVNFMP